MLLNTHPSPPPLPPPLHPLPSLPLTPPTPPTPPTLPTPRSPTTDCSISQIIKDDYCLPFYEIFILCLWLSVLAWTNAVHAASIPVWMLLEMPANQVAEVGTLSVIELLR
jgi:hypothetical protein